MFYRMCSLFYLREVPSSDDNHTQHRYGFGYRTLYAWVCVYLWGCVFVCVCARAHVYVFAELTMTQEIIIYIKIIITHVGLAPCRGWGSAEI